MVFCHWLFRQRISDNDIVVLNCRKNKLQSHHCRSPYSHEFHPNIRPNPYSDFLRIMFWPSIEYAEFLYSLRSCLCKYHLNWNLIRYQRSLEGISWLVHSLWLKKERLDFWITKRKLMEKFRHIRCVYGKRSQTHESRFAIFSKFFTFRRINSTRWDNSSFTS